MVRISLNKAFVLIVASVLVGMLPSITRAGAEDGKAFFAQKCQVCHSVAGVGGKMASMGGSLDGVATKRGDVWLRAYLKDPKSKMPDGKMPKMPMTDQQLEDVVAYLSTLTAAAGQ